MSRIRKKYKRFDMSFRSDASLAMAVLIAAIGSVVPLAARQPSYESVLYAGSTLRQGDTLASGDGCMELRFSYADGYYNRLELRGNGGGCAGSNWDSYADFDWQGVGQGLHTSASEPRGMRAAEATMQQDGNFVVSDIQDGVAIPVFATHTDGNPGAYLRVQEDGNMVVYSASGAVLWSLF
jgi:hypothetical protein